ncbi:MAG: hypothetical protein LBO05_14950 [Deltaproteobacteria bacterium]|nr:hypothetical protein [Deltaproteobacteria bacterium]
MAKVDVGQSAMSRHMKILAGSGMAAAHKQGKWTYYPIREEGYENAARLPRELTTVTPGAADDNAKCRDDDAPCC